MPWIYQVLNNTAKDFWRSKNREPTFLGLDAISVLPDRSDPVDVAIDRERVRELLDDLSADLRQALVDHFVGGISYRDIGAALGIPESTLRGRINRATEELQKAEKSRIDDLPSTSDVESERHYGEEHA
jgi:RNA polymerase sigma-70 factor (ECF subfamily)